MAWPLFWRASLIRRALRLASAGLCLAAAVIWALPMLASLLLALLRYGFGSLFVVGESIAAALLRSAGADIAGTLERLHAGPWEIAAQAACGLVLAAGAARLVLRQPAAAALLAAASAAEAWWFGLTLVMALLLPAMIAALISIRG